jgi:hypothetical protein
VRSVLTVQENPPPVGVFIRPPFTFSHLLYIVLVQIYFLICVAICEILRALREKIPTFIRPTDQHAPSAFIPAIQPDNCPITIRLVITMRYSPGDSGEANLH